MERRLVLVELLLLEPQTNLLLGRLNRVGTVGDVSADINGIVTSDGTRSGLQGVGSTKNGSTLLDNVLTFPNGSKNRTRHHVLEQTGEERLLLKVFVVFPKKLLSRSGKLDTDKLEASVLESAENRGDETSLNTVGLKGLVVNLIIHGKLKLEDFQGSKTMGPTAEKSRTPTLLVHPKHVARFSSSSLAISPAMISSNHNNLLKHWTMAKVIIYNSI